MRAVSAREETSNETKTPKYINQLALRPISPPIEDPDTGTGIWSGSRTRDRFPAGPRSPSGMTGARRRTASKRQDGGIPTDNRTKKRGTEEINEELICMAHEGVMGEGSIESEDSEEESGTIEQAVRLQGRCGQKLTRDPRLP